jgi:iron(III) transport system substrate-binding protein
MTRPKIASVFGKLIAIPIAILFTVHELHGQDAGLMQAAKAERAVVFYSSSSIAEMKPLVDAFSEKYPFMRPELYRASSEKLQSRILTEDRAGASHFDVVQTNGPEFEDLIRRGLIAAYRSPQRQAYSDMNKDREGHWTNLHSSYYVLGYNPKLVPKASIPRDWKDLLEQQWKGNIAMDLEEYSWYGAMREYYGDEFGKKFMHGLAMQRPVFRRGHSLLAELLAAGEFPLALVYAHRVEAMKAKGAPIDWVKGTKPIVAEGRLVGMSAKTRRANAAKLFLDFILSREGQEILRNLGRVVARQDLQLRTPALDPNKLALFPVSPSVSGRLNIIASEFREVFGLR